MIFDSTGASTIISQDKPDLKSFLKDLNKGYEKVLNDNLIINLFSFDKLTVNDVLEFKVISDAHRDKKKSFVLVTNKVAFEELPGSLVVVPSLQEAHDIIEMEEIERDLGF